MGTSRKVRGFLALPGEIRNRIYSYYFETDYHCEIAPKGSSFEWPNPLTVTLYPGLLNITRPTNYTSKSKAEARVDSPTVIRISRRLGKYNAVQVLQTNWQNSLYALHLVCRLVYTETVTFLYRKTLYKFNAPQRLEAFFSIVSAPRLESLAKLQLYYDTYGSPQNTVDLIWQHKHGQSW
jgi:hypothetical protein